MVPCMLDRGAEYNAVGVIYSEITSAIQLRNLQILKDVVGGYFFDRTLATGSW